MDECGLRCALNVRHHLLGHSMPNHQMVPWVTPHILLKLKSYDAFMNKILSRKFQLYSLYGLKLLLFEFCQKSTKDAFRQRQARFSQLWSQISNQ